MRKEIAKSYTFSAKIKSALRTEQPLNVKLVLMTTTTKGERNNNSYSRSVDEYIYIYTHVTMCSLVSAVVAHSASEGRFIDAILN